VAAAGAVHRGADGVEPVHEGGEVLDAVFAVEDGGDKLAGDLAGFTADGAVAFGFPSVSVEGRSIATSTSQSDARCDWMTSVVIAHKHLANLRETGLEFDAPLNKGSFRIGGFHEEEGVRVNEVHADFPLASSPSLPLSHHFDHHLAEARSIVVHPFVAPCGVARSEEPPSRHDHPPLWPRRRPFTGTSPRRG